MCYGTGRDTGAAFDAVFKAFKFFDAFRHLRGFHIFGIFQITPIFGNVCKKRGDVHHQISDRPESVQGGQGDGYTLQIFYFGGASQAFCSIDFAGAGAAGRMVSGMPVHQGGVLLETDFFQTIEDSHVGLYFDGEVLELGWVDVSRFVAQNTKCDFFNRHVGVFFTFIMNGFFFYFFYLDRTALISECGMWNSDLEKGRIRF